MPKGANSSGSDQVRITLSTESVRLLDELAEKGIYGRNRAEVAARFVDQALQDFVQKPTLELGPRRGRKG
ncbi:MAG: hypothetical protein KC766_02740 [Myxococcales bacterium]|nr:hypothetical protein [Myxococcales bacterium]